MTTYRELLARRDTGFHLAQGGVAVYRPAPIVAEIRLFGGLLFADGGELLLGAEAGIRLPLPDEPFGVGPIDPLALTLPVGAVGAVVAVGRRALVEGELVVGKDLEDRFDRAGHLAFLVGVLDAQVEDAAALVGEAFVRDRAEEVPKVHEAGGAGGHAGDLRPFGQTARRVVRLDFGDGRLLVEAGEEQVGKCVVVHQKKLLCGCNHADSILQFSTVINLHPDDCGGNSYNFRG